MHRTNEIIILSLTLLVATINVVNAENPRIVFSATATEKDVELLDPIEPHEALPIILYENEAGNIVPHLYPTDLAVVEINDGRIWSSQETRFLSMPPSSPVFFCPDLDETNDCLVPEPFEQPRALQCKREPKFVIAPIPKSICGPKNEGIAFKFEYDFCPPVLVINMFSYSFCYDEIINRNLFVHYRIQSPKLLSEKLLTREQELKFDQLSAETYGKIDLGYKMYLDAQVQLKPSYKLQKLAPPNHMAFYTWKKTTNHFINTALQHEKLFDLWNEIQDYVAADASAMFASIRNVLTGVVDIPQDELPIQLEDTQMYNIWITNIVDASVKPVRAITILMNNFIDGKETDDLNHDTSASKQQYIDQLCSKEVSVCVESLKQKFGQVGGQVRCCQPTEKITSLLNAHNPIPIDRLLRIRNISTD